MPMFFRDRINDIYEAESLKRKEFYEENVSCYINDGCTCE